MIEIPLAAVATFLCSIIKCKCCSQTEEYDEDGNRIIRKKLKVKRKRKITIEEDYSEE